MTDTPRESARWTVEELDRRWSEFHHRPSLPGQVRGVCVRPDVDQRDHPAELTLTPERGAIGDRWERKTWMYLPDGSPDPRVQIAVANVRILTFLEELTGVHHHPGDTLLVDHALDELLLPTGSRVRAGTALLEVTEVENDGCAKFALHYGQDALAWIRHPKNRTLRLRGLFARVVQAGRVRVGDRFEKV